MAAPQPPPKSRNRRDLREGRRARDTGSSQDASEEDNDVSDVGSLISVNAPTASAGGSPRIGGMANSRPLLPLGAGSNSRPMPPLNAILRRANDKRTLLSENEAGLESPTYDGDIESSSTIGTPVHAHHQHMRRPSSPTPGAPSPGGDGALGRAPTPKASRAVLAVKDDPSYHPADVIVVDSIALKNPYKHKKIGQNSDDGPERMYERPEELPLENIRAFVQRAMDGRGMEDGVERWWRTRPPPDDRPVRIYADGVYDLFHFGHALQLRQAKLSFPRVHLLAGVCSDQLCADNKSPPAMTHAERCEAVRQCRWVDEVLPDAPWVPDQNWVDRWQIDYIAHDEIVYPSKDHDDVYEFIKGQGRFLPTRRTPSISTSDLLERIVRGYRDGFFDLKLEKNGQTDLLAADVDWDSDKSVERRHRRKIEAQRKKAAARAELISSGSMPNTQGSVDYAEPMTKIK